MKASELREETVAALREREESLSVQLRDMRIQRVTGQLDSPARVKNTKKDLARVLTVLREKLNAADGNE